MTDDPKPHVPREQENGDEGIRTRRAQQRAREDQRYTPVIVKRTDEARRHPDDILQTAIREGREQHERPVLSLALSSVAAGLIVGFTAMAVGIVAAATVGMESDIARRLAMGAVYPIGFILCIMSGTELFTEHTAMAVYPVLDRQSRVSSLMRLWAVVAAGNLLGAFGSAALLALAESIVGAREGYIAVAQHAIEPSFWPLMVSSLLAGWLMALGAWLILSTPPTISQMLSIYLVTFLIGIGGLHHSIAGSAEVFTAALLSDAFSLTAIVGFISTALLGNLVGGSLFVAVLNYGHIRESQQTDD